MSTIDTRRCKRWPVVKNYRVQIKHIFIEVIQRFRNARGNKMPAGVSRTRSREHTWVRKLSMAARILSWKITQANSLKTLSIKYFDEIKENPPKRPMRSKITKKYQTLR